jgi:hypothetical protein
MTGERALEVFARAIIREMMSAAEPSAPKKPRASRSRPVADDIAPPQPRFDFTPDTDPEYDRLRRAELDRLASTGESQAQARAQRIRERAYPEDLPMRGMAPPEEV